MKLFPALPPEIEDRILLHTDLHTAVLVRNEYACRRLYDPAVHTVEWACSYGCLDLVRYLSQKTRTRLGYTEWTAVFSNGHLHIVHAFSSSLCNPVPPWGVAVAAGYGHLDLVAYMLDSMYHTGTYAFVPESMDNAVANGHLHVVKYFLSRDMRGTINEIDHAARCGRVDVIHFLHAWRIRGTPAAMAFACRYGHSHVVQVLLRCNYRFSWRALCNYAISRDIQTLLSVHVRRSART